MLAYRIYKLNIKLKISISENIIYSKQIMVILNLIILSLNVYVNFCVAR